ncbi:hypothetical protein P8605_30230 [Streptomyces sp. T-3]|nr:hypothetical protein [Streptomyces sp. T-3]
MRQNSIRSLWRRTAVAAMAAAGITAASLTGIAGTAHAEDAAPVPLSFTGPQQFGLSLNGDPDEEPGEPQISLGLRAPGEDPDGDTDPVPIPNDGYKVTIDASALQGFAKVKLPRACAVEGLVAVCEESDLYPGESYNPRWRIRLDLLDGAKAGDFGKIKVTGAGAGLEFAEHNLDVLVGGPEIRMRKLPAEPEDFAAGDTYRAPMAFRNVGSMSADGVVLRYSGSRGLSFPESYENCEYAETDKGDLLRQRTVALCTFEGEFLPGKAYELSAPVDVKTADFALGDNFGYHFSAVAPKDLAKLRAGVNYRAGSGAKLGLKPVEPGQTGDYVKYASEIDLPSKGSYDLDLTGGRAAGAKGDIVKVDVGLRNHGPAWIGALRSGGEPIAFTVDVPEGASVTKSSEHCGPVNTGSGPDKSQYRCWADTPFLEDEARSFPFEFRIDKVVKGSLGKVHLPEWENPWEGDPRNDVGWIVLNGTGDEETPGDTGGSTGGGNGGSTGGSTGGGGSDGGGTSGSSEGSTGGNSGSDGEGGLASTGATVTLVAGGAALALAAGGTLYLSARRRKLNDAA